MVESSQEHQRIFLIAQQQYEKTELSDSKTEGGRKLTGIKTESEQELWVYSRDKLDSEVCPKDVLLAV